MVLDGWKGRGGEDAGVEEDVTLTGVTLMGVTVDGVTDTVTSLICATEGFTCC